VFKSAHDSPSAKRPPNATCGPTRLIDELAFSLAANQSRSRPCSPPRDKNADQWKCARHAGSGGSRPKQQHSWSRHGVKGESHMSEVFSIGSIDKTVSNAVLAFINSHVVIC